MKFQGLSYGHIYIYIQYTLDETHIASFKHGTWKTLFVNSPPLRGGKLEFRLEVAGISRY